MQRRDGVQEFTVEVDGEVLVYEPLRGPWEDSAAMARLMSWLVANAVDPERVPLPSRATIAGGLLTVELYAVDDAGRKHVVGDGDDAEPARTVRTVPLVVDPPDCWVRREAATG